MAAHHKKPLAKTAYRDLPSPPVPQQAQPPAAMDPGVDLLMQAYNVASEAGNVMLAAQIAGGLSRLQYQNRRIAALEAELASERAKVTAGALANGHNAEGPPGPSA